MRRYRTAQCNNMLNDKVTFYVGKQGTEKHHRIAITKCRQAQLQRNMASIVQINRHKSAGGGGEWAPCGATEQHNATICLTTK